MPPAAPTRVVIPMTSGHEASVDERSVPATKLLRAENAYWPQPGAVQVRPAYERVPAADFADIANARAIASTGRELIAVRDIDIAAYEPQTESWTPRPGAIGPFATTITRRIGDEASYPLSDMDEVTSAGKTWRMIAHQQLAVVGTTAPVYSSGVTIRTETADRQVRAPYRDYYQLGTALAYAYGPRVVHAGTVLATIFERHDVASGQSTLWAVDADAAASVATLTDRGAITAAGAVVRVAALGALRQSITTRSFDAVGGPTYYHLAYVEPVNGDVILERRNSAHVVQATLTISNNRPYRRVAITRTGTNDVTLLLEGSAGGANSGMYLAKYDYLPLGNIWYSAALSTHVTASDFAENLGVAVGTFEGASRAIATWGLAPVALIGPAAMLSWQTYYRSADYVAGAGFDALTQIWNSIPITRPWCTDGRGYVVVAHDGQTTTSGDFDLAAAACSAALVCELSGTTVVTPRRIARLAGVHHLGTAMTARENGAWGPGFATGSAPSQVLQSATTQTSDVRYVVAVRTGTTIGDTSLGVATRDRWGCDEVHQLHGQPVGVVSPWEGAAVIGGSLVSWYDGERTVELGEPVGPHVESAAAIVAGGLLAGIATTHIGSWEARDALGILHRGPPGPACPAVTPGGANTGVAVTHSYLGVSNWSEQPDPAGRLGVLAYRSNAGGLYQRSIEVSAPYTNSYGNTGFPWTTYSDGGLFSGEQLYVLTGELEAVCPEPARYPSIVAQRIWLGGGAFGGEARYSKLLYQDGAIRIAPEFHEVMTLPVPSSEPVVAVAELDGRMVILTGSRTYVLSGQGPDDAGRSSDYGPLQLASADYGCTDARSVVVTPAGVMWRAAQEIVLLDRSLGVQRVGAAVSDITDAYPVTVGAHYIASDHTVRYVVSDTEQSKSVVLVFAMDLQAWSPWYLLDPSKLPVVSQLNFTGACVHAGVHHLLISDGRVLRQSATATIDNPDGTNSWITLALETAWVQLGGPCGWQVAQAWYLLAKRLGPGDLVTRTYEDFNATATQAFVVPSATLATWPEQPRIQPRIDVRRIDAQAHKLRVEIIDPIGTTDNRGLSIAAIVFEGAPDPGASRIATVSRS